MIEVQNLSKIYTIGKVSLKALSDVSFRIEKGKMVAIAGVSGSGKSTLLHIIGGMDRPTEGKVIVDGEDIGRYNSSKLTEFRGKKIGFVFQNFNLIPALNVYENIVVPMKLKNQKYERNEIMELIEKVGLEKHIRHRPDELSGGQKQRVAIARALANKPDYVLADEPTANLDSKTSKEIMDLFVSLNRELGITILIASHDQEILKKTEHIIRLQDGKVIQHHI
ncbi:MAG: ABC transporter ATP-binding protein [Brevinematales bacterium]